MRLFQDGLTGLHWAAICGRDPIVRFLLKSGADANAIDKVSTSDECFNCQFLDPRSPHLFLHRPSISWTSLILSLHSLDYLSGSRM